MAETVLDIFLDCLKDSAIVFGIVLVVYILLALFEPKFSHKMEHAGRWAPLIGAGIGLIPQCGFSVVGADLYHKKHITLGTVIAIFVATSDEALPVFLGSVGDAQMRSKVLMVLPLLGIKFVAAVAFGYAIDAIYRRSTQEVHHHEEECECEEVVHVGCCHHHIEEEETKESKVHQYLVHPLIHSLKIFAYVFVVNMVFNIILELVGEEAVMSFLQTSRYAAPVFAVLVGLIPNCASSVMLAELYLMGGLSFGACVGGLCVNAGLGLMMLYRNVKDVKHNLMVTGIMVAIGLIVGYTVFGIMEACGWNAII